MEQSLQQYNAEQRTARWAEIITQCRNSGMSVKNWCEQEGIKLKTYYYWQRKLYQAAYEQAEFVQIPDSPDVPDIAVEIRMNGIVAAVRSGADTATIANVLAAMRRC